MKRGFTLIEVLVAVFVFVIMFLIAAAFINLASGQTKSSQTQALTTDMRNTVDIINQKMNGANGKNTTSGIYGFKFQSNILGIASDNGCTFIGKTNDSLVMRTTANNASCIFPTSWVSTDSYLTPISTVQVTNFGLVPGSSSYLEMNSGNAAILSQSPYIKLQIIAKDTDPKFQDSITLQTAYSMDYLTVQRLKQL